jgi:hypothetical protein
MIAATQNQQRSGRSHDLLDYRAIGNVVLTLSQPLLVAPNNINAH